MKLPLLLLATIAFPVANAPLEQLRKAYVSCVQIASVDEYIAPTNNGNLAAMVERAFLSCQSEENALLSASFLEIRDPYLIRAARTAFDGFKARLKSELINAYTPTRR